MFIIDSHCTSDPGVGTHLRTRLTGLCSGMPAVFSDPIISRGIGREASANQPPLATNRYIPTADGHINLGGDLAAVLNKRDPLNLDSMAEGFESFDTLIPGDIGQPAQIALPVPSPFIPPSIILVIPPNGEEITQDTTTINTHNPITTQDTTGVEDNQPVTLRDMGYYGTLHERISTLHTTNGLTTN